ncbi:hypothetical protein ACFL23_04780 [Patescibacteria group bacterium]
MSNQDNKLDENKKEDASDNVADLLDDKNKDINVQLYSNPFIEGDTNQHESEDGTNQRESEPVLAESYDKAKRESARRACPAYRTGRRQAGIVNESTGIEGGEDLVHKESEAENGNKNNVKLFMVKQKLLSIKKEINDLLNSISSDEATMKYEQKLVKMASPIKKEEIADNAVDVIDGIFNGQQMIGKDGKEYDVPVNYSSKSKLVEGDMLKLRILQNGKYYYKQTEKMIRINKVGQLAYDEDGKQYYVIVGDKKYKVLSASITYFKSQIGDEIIITVPKDRGSEWAAVETAG